MPCINSTVASHFSITCMFWGTWTTTLGWNNRLRHKSSNLDGWRDRHEFTYVFFDAANCLENAFITYVSSEFGFVISLNSMSVLSCSKYQNDPSKSYRRTLQPYELTSLFSGGKQRTNPADSITTSLSTVVFFKNAKWRHMWNTGKCSMVIALLSLSLYATPPFLDLFSSLGGSTA